MSVLKRIWRLPRVTSTLGSLAIYGAVALGLSRAKPAFVFLLVPPASWLLTAIVVPITALTSRRLSRRGDGA
jgi:hypothetical protein